VIASVPLLPCVTVMLGVEGERVIPGATPIVRFNIVVDERLPEAPVMVTVELPGAAEVVAAKVMTLELVVGLVPKLAVTPVGRPVAVSVTLPVKPFTAVRLMVSVALAPWSSDRDPVVGASVKLGAAFTVSAMVAEAVSVPEVPVIVTVARPVVAVLVAVNVRTLEPVAGFVPKLAVTPAGRPVAVKVTLPVKPLAAVTLTVSGALAPCVTDSTAATGASVKLGGAFTVTAIVVEAVSDPDVPVIVTVAGPVVAVLVAARVRRLEPVAGLVPKLAVTPAGSPVAVRVTPLAHPLAAVTLIVSVAVLPGTTDKVPAVGASVKLGAPFTVSAMVTEAVSVPEVPVIVTVARPVVAVLVAVNVSTLAPAAGFVPKLAVTPVGSPVAARVTLPVKPLAGVTVTVSDALLPWFSATVGVVATNV
jgi:hypothetical protein